MLISPKLAIPVVVVELLLGIVIGPDGLDWAKIDPTTDFLGDLGLGMLFFFAGYEIDFDRIKGRPLRLGVLAWVLSLVLAYGIGGILAAAGVVLSYLYTGSAMATTAIGTLIPILKDRGEIKTRFGTYLLAGGGMGEFGPILLVTLILSTTNPMHEAVILVAFVVIAVFTGLLAVSSAWRGWPLVERTLETSSQVAVRLAVVLVFGLVALAAELGLDMLLGGFVAGMITRQALRRREVGVLESKLTAVGYGLLIPFFFITSGMEFDLDALTSSAEAVLKMIMFVGLFLVVRGIPALLLYSREFTAMRDRAALAFYFSTELPLVVAITTIAVDQGHMKSSTAAGLVGAAIISTLVFPLVAMRLRRGSPARAGGRGGNLVDDGEALVEAAEVAVPVLADDHQVLDADAHLPGHVDARLDRDHVAGPHMVLGAGGQSRRLVHLDPDAMAEPVPEALALAGGLDQLAGDGIGLAAREPRPKRLQRRRLRLAHQFVDLGRLGAGIAGRKGAGAIRAVPVQLGPHVEDHQLRRPDLAGARLGVRERAVRAGRDDRRERGLGAELADAGLAGTCDVALGPARQAPGDRPAIDLVAELGGGGDPLHLPFVLDRPQLFHQVARWDQLDPLPPPTASSSLRSWRTLSLASS